MGNGLLEDPTSYLKASDVGEELEEENDFPEDYWYRTHLTCSSCEEHICYDEEIICVLIVQAQQVFYVDELTGQQKQRIEYYPVLKDDEDFAYEPLLLHFDCWESICDEYHELIADELPMIARSPVEDLTKCTFCKTGIGPWEEFAHVSLGEIAVSERRKETTFKETEGGSPEPVCLGCLERINEQCIELWKS